MPTTNVLAVHIKYGGFSAKSKPTLLDYHKKYYPTYYRMYYEKR